jgi:plasmid stability protein
MAAVTIRNLSDEAHRALKLRAAKNKRSTEAEIRDILESAVRPTLRVGSELVELGKRFGGVDLDLPQATKPIEPASFE